MSRSERQVRETIVKKNLAMPLDDAITAFLADLTINNYSPKTMDGYRKKLSAFAAWAKQQQSTQVQHLTIDLLRRYILYLRQKEKWSERDYHVKATGPLRPQSIKNYVRDIKRFAGWLYENHYTAQHVLEALPLPRTPEVRPEPLSTEELEHIIASFDVADHLDLRDLALVTLLLDTGMRIGEIVKLELKDINLMKKVINIDEAKFGKYRILGFGETTKRRLSQYLAVRPHMAQEWTKNHLFLTEDGYSITEATAQKICQKISVRTGIHVYCHRFRHTFAVNMLNNGADIRYVQLLMGHSDIRITARYLNIANDDVLEVHHTHSPADRIQQHQLENGRRRGRRHRNP